MRKTQLTITTYNSTAKIKNSDNTQCWGGCREPGSHRASRNVKWYKSPKESLAVSFKTQYVLTIWPGILGIYLPQMKPEVHIKTGMWILRAALSVIAPNRKLFRLRSSMGESLNKQRYIHTLGYDSTLKRNELLIHETIWIDLKGIMVRGKKPK